MARKIFEVEEVDCILCNNSNKKIIFSVEPCKVVRCNKCGLIFTSPRPTKQQHSIFHGEANFRMYYKMGIEEFYEKTSDIFKQELVIKNKRLELINKISKNRGNLLDVGTGQGLFLILAKEKGYNVYGTDISEYVCSFLKQRGINTFCGYLEEANYSSNFFDIITLWHVLEHTLNPLITLEEINRILKPEGYLIIALPNITFFEILLRKILNKPLFRINMNEWHLYHFNEQTIKKLLKKTKFDIIKMEREPLYIKTQRYYWVEVIRYFISKILHINLSSTILIYCKKEGVQT